MSDKGSNFRFEESFKEISHYVDNIECQLEKINQEIQILRDKLSHRSDSLAITWQEMLLAANQPKSVSMYKRLFEEIPSHAKVKGKFQGYIIGMFRGEFPQKYSWHQLQEMKTAGELTQRELEIYDAINNFKAICSQQKWLD